MPNSYTADDLNELAGAIDDFAASLPVDAPGQEGLDATTWSGILGGTATNLRLMAVRDYLAEAAEPMKDIVAAARDAQHAAATLRNIARTVELAGDVALLASIIWLQKWNLVVPTLKELRKDVTAS